MTVSGDGAMVEIWPTLDFRKRVAAAADEPDLDERQAVKLTHRLVFVLAASAMLTDRALMPGRQRKGR